MFRSGNGLHNSSALQQVLMASQSVSYCHRTVANVAVNRNFKKGFIKIYVSHSLKCLNTRTSSLDMKL